jgi:hypothetical protein
MLKISRSYEIVKKLSKGYEVYVLEEEAANFLKIAPKAILLKRNIHQSERNDLAKKIVNYRDFRDVENDLLKLVKDYPQLTSLEIYGVSKEGRNLYSLKISSGGDNKPKLLITAATHGDELITTEVLFSLTNELLSSYGKSPRLTKIIDTKDIYIVPVVSPDSFEARERYVQRKDPNRSYPWPDNTTNKPVDVIEGMINYTNKYKFTGSLDLHAYGKLVMYPWAYTKKAPPSNDESGFRDLTLSMARDNQYTTGQISTTIYVAEGSSADYFYWKSKTKAIAVEIGREKIPHFSKIPAIVNESREMIWTFLEYFN